MLNSPLGVSIKLISQKLLVSTVQIMSRFPQVHGASVYIGNSKKIGIQDIDKPDFGDPVTIKIGEALVFWACGVTPQAIVMSVKPKHHDYSFAWLFVSGLKDEHYAMF